MSLPLEGVRVVSQASARSGLLAPFVRVGGALPDAVAAPVLGADTASVLAELG